MKKLVAYFLLFISIIVVAIQACNKEEEVVQPNYPPVAHAGIDSTYLFTDCEPKVIVRLDGHLSYDPENNGNLSYRWKQLSGPSQGLYEVDPTHEVAYLYRLVSGQYMFELEVVDSKGLSSRDSVIVSINNITDYSDLELDLAGMIEYTNNYQDFYYPDIYYDILAVYGETTISNENYAFNFNASGDSAVVNTNFTNWFSLYGTAGNSTNFINGECTVDFDLLYAKGGGAFTGTIKVTAGSAFEECEDLIPDIPPIQITGNMQVASKTLTMKLKGKIIL